jgi:acyl-homoserine lactone acylase PvdQ
MNQATPSPFINYPKQAAFGRVLPKNKIYEHSGATPAVREMFVRQVEQIVWQYKLAPETINLASKPGVPELQIFAIQLKTPTLNHEVLRCIDGAVQFPIIFELTFEGKTQVVAAFKRPSESDSNRWVVSEYFPTQWMPNDVVRTAMPLALDLGTLYEQLLQRLIPLTVRQNEALAELVTRVEDLRLKEKEVQKIVSKLAKEKQFNRKVEINAQLRAIRQELENLTN